MTTHPLTRPRAKPTRLVAEVATSPGAGTKRRGVTQMPKPDATIDWSRYESPWPLIATAMLTGAVLAIFLAVLL